MQKPMIRAAAVVAREEAKTVSLDRVSRLLMRMLDYQQRLAAVAAVAAVAAAVPTNHCAFGRYASVPTV